MLQSCGCGEDKVLKCSGISCCRGCINNYFDNDTHELSSIDFPSKIRNNKEFLEKILENEQIAKSEFMRYLDKVQEWMKAEVERAVGIVKQEVADKYYQQKHIIESYMHSSSPEVQSKIDALRRSENTANRVMFNKTLFSEAVKSAFPEINLEVQEVVRKENKIVFVDFLDNRTLRLLTPKDGETKCEYKSIENEFILFPHSRYCFVNEQHLIVSGGLGSQPTNHAFVLSVTDTCQSRRISDLQKSRCKHATCHYPPDSLGFVYVFGGNGKFAEIEKLEITQRIFDSLHNSEIRFLSEDEGPHWKDLGNLYCEGSSYPLETAACVVHSNFIYISGSHPTRQFSILKFDPLSNATTLLSPLQEVVRFPCVLAAWHTQMMVLFCDGSKYWRFQWTLGNTFNTEEKAEMRLKVAGKRQPWEAICPPVTFDFNCFIHAETERGTLLLCYDFIQQEVSLLPPQEDPR